MYNYSILSIFLFSFFPLSSQSFRSTGTENLDLQWIVRLDDHIEIRELKSKIPATSLRDVTFRQLMKEPLNLWLIETTVANQREIIKSIKSFRGTSSVHQNRMITSRKSPDDPRLNQQWQYSNDGTNGVAGADMEMYPAWDFATGGITMSGDTIVVCVIDDGINGNHPDMKENMWVNHNEIPNNGQDDDGNGYTDDYRGWNITTNNDDVWSGGGHGTPVAGIIGARGNNGIGVSGVNWNVKLMSVDYVSANEANALSSYAYAYTMRKLYNQTQGKKGAYIVATNASWGVDGIKAEEAPLWCDLYDKLGEIGIMNVAATTNSDTDVDTEGDLPTSCTSEFLISVTNLNKSDVKISGAGYGRKSIDLGAYGHQAFTVTRNDYGTFGGTSGATPHVTGVVALLYSLQCAVFDSIVIHNPSGAALVVKDMILHGTELLPSLQNVTTTNGKLNAFRSISNLNTLCTKNAPPAGIIITPEDEKVKISWIRGNEALVAIRYRKSDDFNWTVIERFTNGDSIGGLDFCTEYEVQIGTKLGMLSGDYSYSKFFTTSGCCTLPNISNIVASDESIAFEWSTNTAALLNIKYRPFDESESQSIIVGTNFNLDDLTKCKAYVFNVQAQCTKYGNQSEVSEDIVISTSCDQCTELNYCSFSTKSNDQEWISAVSIDQDTFKTTTSPSGYINYAGAKEYTLKIDSVYNISLTPEFQGTAFSEYFYVYIDYDQNGQWSDNERIFYTPNGVRETVSGQFVVPRNSKTGYTRMRVMMSYDSLSGGCDQPKFEYGEVEDYCVNIWAKECIFNSDIKSVPSTYSVKFYTEIPLQSLDTLIVFYRESGEENFSEIKLTDTLTINELKKCTEYEYYFEKYCDEFNKFRSPIKTTKTLCSDNTENDIENINIFPNPTVDYIKIFNNNQYVINFNEVVLKDITGRNFIPDIKSKDGNTMIMDMRALPSGIYSLQFGHQNGMSFKSIKIVKL